MDERTNAIVNGSLIVLGAAAVIDNIVFHWLLEWHRMIEGVPDPEMFLIELGVVVVGAILFAIGCWREWHARQV